ncbi:MAG: hypothetical protein IPH60_10835 [Flavobacteriales bacterium]|nr:hypothetical protein [Flavobacteriales bacterium]
MFTIGGGLVLHVGRSAHADVPASAVVERRGQVPQGCRKPHPIHLVDATTLLPPLFALAGLLPFSLNAQSTVRTINDGFETAFGSEGEMTLLTDGDVLGQDGHTVMRLHPDGTVAWMRITALERKLRCIGDIGEEIGR